MTTRCQHAHERHDCDHEQFAKRVHVYHSFRNACSKHFPPVVVPLINMRLREPGAVPLLGILQPRTRSTDVIVLRHDPPQRRVNHKILNVRRVVYRKINLFEENHQFVGVPGNEHFIERGTVDVLPHAQQVGAVEVAVFQTIGLKTEGLAETRDALLAIGDDEKEIAAGLELLAGGSFPALALDSDGFQEFLGLVAHGRIYAV